MLAKYSSLARVEVSPNEGSQRALRGSKEVAEMTTAMTATKKWQDQYLSMMARVEEPVVRFAGRATEAVADYVPERPQWAFLAQLPTMAELVDSQLKFRKQVVDEQASFVRKLIKATSPKAPAAKPVVGKASPARRVGVKAA
jgi:hypothetical protein